MSNIDWKFIEDLEGCSLVGYIPFMKGSNSGVTIGCGFDLGQVGVGELVNMFGQYNPLTDELAKYASLKSYDAKKMLTAFPLTLKGSDVEKINEAVRCDQLISVELLAKRDLPFWDQLPIQIRTVIMSVAYQYGHLPKRTPNFWMQIKEQDWEGALANLRDFKDDYPTRRNKEADLLESYLNNIK